MKITSFNIEWMNNWFVGNGQVGFRDIHKGTDIGLLAQRVGNLIKTLDSDVLAIQEGPSDIREMLLFTDTYLKDSSDHPIYDVFGGIDGRAQKPYIFVKRNSGLQNPRLATDNHTTNLDNLWKIDIDGDSIIDDYGFTRLPLIVDVDTANGNTLRVVTLHTKSKYIHNGKSMWNNPNKKSQFIEQAILSRRRISSEATRVRQYLSDIIKSNISNVVVTGDWNDGPGREYFEQFYLLHNVTDVILGSAYNPSLMFTHAFINKIPEDKRYTAIFDDFVEGIQNKKILLDHIAVSPALSDKINNSGINHTEYEAAIDNTAGISERQKYPSDHRPVFVEMSGI